MLHALTWTAVLILIGLALAYVLPHLHFHL